MLNRCFFVVIFQVESNPGGERTQTAAANAAIKRCSKSQCSTRAKRKEMKANTSKLRRNTTKARCAGSDSDSDNHGCLQKNRPSTKLLLTRTLEAITTPNNGAASSAMLTGVASAPARQPMCLMRLLPKKITTKVVIPRVLQ